ncbi:acyl carrier protein phosphodiesterase [Nibribacter koreensis]|uniref:Acyl carrier protein phosphodiesterase n=1 Tax=Nibribacter koreensis TaxID=1084519 RepID=A0ABP8F9Y3_9BACT
MNYLAHLYLSGNDPELKFGNFIADGVRGAQILQFPERIQQGIKLHRLIDQFTDSHAVVKETIERLRPLYKKYAGVVADVYYDHFLAANFQQFSTVPLDVFAEESYAAIQSRPEWLPPKVQTFLPYMVNQNWLVSYAQVWGISKALKGLSRRTTFESNMETAGEELQLNYDFYHQEFNRFFPDLEKYVMEEIERINALHLNA